jgi:hypothetical protein
MNTNENLLEKIDLIAELTNSEPEEWEVTEGPTSGLGEDFFFCHAVDGREVWINIDQDYITITCDGQTLYEGETQE